MRRPGKAAETDREGRRQVLLRSWRSGRRRLRTQVPRPERHHLRHQLERLDHDVRQGEEGEGQAEGRPRRVRKWRRRPPNRSEAEVEHIVPGRVVMLRAVSLACLVATGLALPPLDVRAQEYPARPVRLIVPLGAGRPHRPGGPLARAGAGRTAQAVVLRRESPGRRRSHRHCRGGEVARRTATRCWSSPRRTSIWKSCSPTSHTS